MCNNCGIRKGRIERRLELRIIHSPSRLGTYNLVLEKYLVDHLNEPTLLVWRNRPGIYVGRHQNTLDEIDQEYVEAQGFEVFRRLSGGGTIFHDEYNVYYSLMSKNERSVQENFIYHNNLIVEFLQSVGVDAERSGRNDILVGGRKISGSAEHYAKGNVVHHGSLLYATDILHMAPALTPNKQKFTSKAITSVAQRVDNIMNHVDLSVEEFEQALISFFAEKFSGHVTPITKEEDAATYQLIHDWYGTYEWNYGQSPAFSYEKEFRFPYGIVKISLVVTNGIIKDIKILGDFFATRDLSEIEEHFIGVRYLRKDLEDVLEKINVGDVIVGASNEDVMQLLWEDGTKTGMAEN